MAIVDPISDERRAEQSSDATGIFSSPVVLDVDEDLENVILRRITEPLSDVKVAPVAVASMLLTRADEEEDSESDTADEVAVRPRRRGKRPSRKVTGAEDAFHSYLQDIRGL